MSSQGSMAFVQSLKGASASLLWALQMAGRPLSSRELGRFTNYSEPSVRHALQTLRAAGCIHGLGTFGPWTLVPDWQKRIAYRAAPETLGPAVEESFAGSRNIVSSSKDSFVLREEIDASSEDSSASRLSTRGRGGSSSLSREERKNPLPPPVFKRQAEKNPADKQDSFEGQDFSVEKAPGDPWNFDQNLQAALEAGIEEPGASRISKLPHVTPGYIRAHVRQALAQGRSIGAAVFRMERHWTVPHEATSVASPVADMDAPEVRAPRYRLRSAPTGVRPEGYELVEVQPKAEQRELHPRPANVPEEELPANFEANVQALLEWKGSELVATRLALLPHVTPAFIREHYRQAFENNQDVITALYRIEHNEPLPETWIHGSAEGTDVGREIQALGERLRPRRREWLPTEVEGGTRR